MPKAYEYSKSYSEDSKCGRKKLGSKIDNLKYGLMREEQVNHF
jgi:hypothetical protein